MIGPSLRVALVLNPCLSITPTFQPCPSCCLDLCRSSRASSLSAKEPAGPGLPGAGRSPFSRGGLKHPLPCLFWLCGLVCTLVGLRSEHLAGACQFKTYFSFKRAVGSLDSSNTLCQPIPSFKVYCCAGFSLDYAMRPEELMMGDGAVGPRCVLKWPLLPRRDTTPLMIFQKKEGLGPKPKVLSSYVSDS